MPPTTDEIVAFVRNQATVSGLDPDLAVKQCFAESSYNPAAKSPCGALGLFQIMPATAQQLNIDPLDWKQNVIGWSDYMQQLKRMFGGAYPQMLAAYNAGMGTVRRLLIQWGPDWRNHLPAETAGYLNKIIGPASGAGGTHEI